VEPGLPGDPVALRPLRVGEILDVAIKVYRANFKTLIKAVLVVIAPVQVLTVLLNASTRAITDTTTSFGTTGFSGTGNVHRTGGQVAALVVAALAVTVLGLVGGELASAASFRAVSEAYLGEEPEWRRSLRFALSRLRPLLWLAFLHFLVLAVGFVFCVIPGIYLYGSLAVATPALLLEDVRGSKALRRSRQLVKGRWWPTAGALLAANLLVSIVGGAVSGALLAATVGANNGVVSDILRVVGGTASSMITTPFLAAVIVVLYFDLRVRKEGFDLLLLANHMGVEPALGLPSVSFLPEPSPVIGEGDEPPFWPPPPGWKPRSES
jgi:hypothetical protein